MPTVAILGPLEVRRDGLLVRVPGGKASELLVRLALDAGEFVRADRLVDDLWGGGTVRTARNTLQSKVAMLRRALGPEVVVTTSAGYMLAVEPKQIDALVATSQTVAASRLLEAGDDRGAADASASTLGLYRGELLQAAGEGAWVDVHRARLDEARMTLFEIRFSACLRLGDIGEVLGELEAAVAAHPLREGLWELLITAHYRAGRQADALATYQRIKDRLADELGLDPGPQLQHLERRILTQDASLVVAIGPGARVVADESLGNLPSMSADLVGREREVTAVVELLNTNRLVEIVGPGGIGKTAVAIAAARRLIESNETPTRQVWLARLETATSATEVIDTLIAALHIPGNEEAMLERLKASAPVVILDNCEHLLDAAAAFAVRLLDAAPQLRVLCTSQVPLDIDGEALLELAPLPLDDAVELFTRRAGAQHVSSPSSGGLKGVSDLCRSLDGLPLAIELAAARTKTLTIEEITRRLEDRFRVLADPTSRKPERRRSLRSTIRWSYELLFPDDQRGLWALATFAGGAPLTAVESVLAALGVPAPTTIDVVSRLASRSLLIIDDDVASVHQATRYRLLDSIRAFALEAMDDAHLTDRARGAHASWFAAAAGSSTLGVRSIDQPAHLAVARSERANIDAALAWCTRHDPLLGLQIVNGFGWAWVVLGDSRGAERILTALADADTADPRDRANALLLAAWIEASTSRLELASDHIAAAMHLAEELDDVDLRARAASHLAYVVSHLGDFTRALELTDCSRALSTGLDRPWDEAANLLLAARAAISSGDQGRGGEALDHVQVLLRRVEDPWLRVRAGAMLGELARVQHRFDDAVGHLGRASETSRRLGFAQTEAYQVASLGRAQCQTGDYDTGAATLELAVDKAELTGDVRLAALARVHLGRVLRALGHVDAARTALEAASAWHRSAGGGEQAALGECLLAALDAADDVPGAEQRLTAILEGARRREDAPVEVFALDALARLAATDGDATKVRDLCAEADRRMERASHFITDLDRIDARWVRADSRGDLPDVDVG